MKCVKKGEEIKKVADKETSTLVKDGWVFCPRHEWRKAHPGKDTGKKPVAEAGSEQTEKVSKKARWKSKKSAKDAKNMQEVMA